MFKQRVALAAEAVAAPAVAGGAAAVPHRSVPARSVPALAVPAVAGGAAAVPAVAGPAVAGVAVAVPALAVPAFAGGALAVALADPTLGEPILAVRALAVRALAAVGSRDRLVPLSSFWGLILVRGTFDLGLLFVLGGAAFWIDSQTSRCQMKCARRSWPFATEGGYTISIKTSKGLGRLPFCISVTSRATQPPMHDWYL